MKTTFLGFWIRTMALLASVGLILGAGAPRTLAVGPEVRDAAGIFSAAAVKDADETVRRIQRDYRKELLIETFAAVPESRTEEYAKNREEFFNNFVRERAMAARLDGIYVLIMKEQPPHRYRIQVGVGQVTRQRAFTLSDRDALVKTFQSSFREDKFDEALRNGVALVERTLQSNLQGPVATKSNASGLRVDREASAPGYRSSSSSIGSIVVLVLFIFIGVLVVGFIIRLLRGAMGGTPGLGGAGGMGGGMGYGGGGGGFFSSLLGGIGGAMAGSWLYDRLFSNTAHADDVHSSSSDAGVPSDFGRDFSSSGGDVDVSGGDFGGGGGGDFGGGGDSGGGGGDA